MISPEIKSFLCGQKDISSGVALRTHVVNSCRLAYLLITLYRSRNQLINQFQICPFSPFQCPLQINLITGVINDVGNLDEIALHFTSSDQFSIILILHFRLF